MTSTTECASCGTAYGPDRETRWEAGQADLESWDRCERCGAPLCDGCALPPVTRHDRPGTGTECAAPGWPKFSYLRNGDRSYEIRVRPEPGAVRLDIGTVARFGSLPSMTRWAGCGDWPGAAWTRSRAKRDQAAADVWVQYARRRAGG